MKTFVKWLLVFTIAAVSTTNGAIKPVGKVSFLIGKPNVKKATGKKWVIAKMNRKVRPGDKFKTKKAESAEITLKDGSVIRISEESEITIFFPGGKTISPHVKKGKIWANIKKLTKRDYDFEVSSGTAVAAIRGTVVRMDNSPEDSVTKVMVYSGKVEVGPGKKLVEKVKETKGEGKKEIGGPMEIPGPFEVSLMDWVTIVKGQQINIRPDGKFHKFQFDEQKDAEDPWVKFNKERDAQLVRK